MKLGKPRGLPTSYIQNQTFALIAWELAFWKSFAFAMCHGINLQLRIPSINVYIVHGTLLYNVHSRFRTDQYFLAILMGTKAKIHLLYCLRQGSRRRRGGLGLHSELPHRCAWVRCVRRLPSLGVHNQFDYLFNNQLEYFNRYLKSSPMGTGGPRQGCQSHLVRAKKRCNNYSEIISTKNSNYWRCITNE